MSGLFNITGQDIGPLIFLLFALGPLILRALRGKKTAPGKANAPAPPPPPLSPSASTLKTTRISSMKTAGASSRIFGGSAAGSSSTLPPGLMGPGEIKPSSTLPRFLFLVILLLLAWLVWRSVARKQSSPTGPQGQRMSQRMHGLSRQPAQI